MISRHYWVDIQIQMHSNTGVSEGGREGEKEGWRDERREVGTNLVHQRGHVCHHLAEELSSLCGVKAQSCGKLEGKMRISGKSNLGFPFSYKDYTFSVSKGVRNQHLFDDCSYRVH